MSMPAGNLYKAGGMKTAGIVEACELAPQKYGCFYLPCVGDGNSSGADCNVCNVTLQQHVYQKSNLI